MKFYPVTTAVSDESSLREDYNGAHEVGALRIGSGSLFFRARFRTYYIPYADIDRCFRRIMMVPAKMCCGRGDFEMESLVVCCGGKEVASVDLPGKKAAQLVIEELKGKLPNAEFRPLKAAEAGDEA